MRRPPAISRVLAYPATAGVMLLALAVTLATWKEHALTYNFTLDGRALHGEPWRFVTSALPHGSLLHLVFNLYWTWVFGTLVEERLGHFATFGLYLLFAAISGAAEYALFVGGIGLSGVGYGLFGLCWMLGRSDRRFAGAVDARTVQLFLVWGLLCIVTTVTHVMNVANAAHGMGLVAGVIVGRAIGVNRAYWAILAVLALATAAGASRLRPHVSLSRASAAKSEAYAGQLAENAEKWTLATQLFRGALAIDPSLPVWYHVAWDERKAGDLVAAREAARRACDNDAEAAHACAAYGGTLQTGEGGAIDLAGAQAAYARGCAHGDAEACKLAPPR